MDAPTYLSTAQNLRYHAGIARKDGKEPRAVELETEAAQYEALAVKLEKPEAKTEKAAK